MFVVADGGVEFDQDVVPLHHLAEDAVLAVQVLQLLGQREEKLGAQPADQHGIYVIQAETRREEDQPVCQGGPYGSRHVEKKLTAQSAIRDLRDEPVRSVVSDRRLNISNNIGYICASGLVPPK